MSPSCPLCHSTDTSQVRGNALDSVGSGDSSVRRSTSSSEMTSQRLKDVRPGSPLRIITENDSTPSTNQRTTSAETDRQDAHGRCSKFKRYLSPNRLYGEPFGVTCDGWCKADPIPHATVVSGIGAWWNGRQTLMMVSRLRHAGSCLYQHARIRSALGKAHGVRSLPCCAASSVSAPCSNMVFRATSLADIWSQRNTVTHHTAR
jgi:hypothetical protein